MRAAEHFLARRPLSELDGVFAESYLLPLLTAAPGPSLSALRACAPRLLGPPFRSDFRGRDSNGKMAAPGSTVSPEKPSHKKYRAALKKEKRKKRRQELARLRDSGVSQDEEDALTEEQQLEEEKLLERERSAVAEALKASAVVFWD